MTPMIRRREPTSVFFIRANHTVRTDNVHAPACLEQWSSLDAERRKFRYSPCRTGRERAGPDNGVPSTNAQKLRQLFLSSRGRGHQGDLSEYVRGDRPAIFPLSQ